MLVFLVSSSLMLVTVFFCDHTLWYNIHRWLYCKKVRQNNETKH